MKVELHARKRLRTCFHNSEIGPRPFAVTRSLPFFATRQMSRLHRVRFATAHPKWVDRKRGTYCINHVSFEFWCGGSGSSGRGGIITSEPIDGWPICATCEGRAVGAGQVTSEHLAGRTLLFTPRSKSVMEA